MNIKTGLSVTASPGELSNVKVTPEGIRVRESVPYVFQFLTHNMVDTKSQIRVILPQAIGVD